MNNRSGDQAGNGFLIYGIVRPDCKIATKFQFEKYGLALKTGVKRCSRLIETFRIKNAVYLADVLKQPDQSGSRS